MTDLVVISAGLREPSSTRLLADRLATATELSLARLGGSASTRVIELRPLARDIADAMTVGFAPPALQQAFDTIAGADGVIAVTPAFNASFSGLFKSFFDVLPEDALADLPVLIAATGGTDRHSLVLEHALRPMFTYLHATVSPTAVFASTDDFGRRGHDDPLDRRIGRAGADFAHLLNNWGPRPPHDAFTEELDAMTRLLNPVRD